MSDSAARAQNALVTTHPAAGRLLGILGHEAVAELERHPGLPQAVAAAAAQAVRNYDGNWIRNRLLNDRGRALIAMLMLDLHFTRNEGKGFTASQLRREAVACDLCSPGRVIALVAAMRMGKLLAPMPGDDQRERRLAPTELLLSLHRMRWRNIFAATSPMMPEVAAAALAVSDSQLFGPGMHAIMDAYRKGLRVWDVAPELEPFAERDAGFVILARLHASDESDLTIQAIARQFSVSRWHVTDLLRQAEAGGLLSPTGNRGGYAATPALTRVLTRFSIVIFSLYRLAFAAASADAPPLRPTPMPAERCPSKQIHRE